MGWVGYNVNKSIYHVRGYQQVVAKIGTSEKAAVTVRMEDLRQFQCFISASIVGRKVKDTERYTILNSRKDRPALHKGDDANQGLDFFGLSNNTIADLLRVSKTWAIEIKHEAAKAGYLITNKRYAIDREIAPDEVGFYNKLCKGEIGAAYKVRKGEQDKYYLCRQLHDEIIPTIEYKKSMAVKKANKSTAWFYLCNGKLPTLIEGISKGSSNTTPYREKKAEKSFATIEPTNRTITP